MCMVLCSVNCAEADLTCASSRISCDKPQSPAAAAGPAVAAGMVAASHAQSATQNQIPTRLKPMSCPEVVEIEPVEGCRAAVMFEPRHVTAHRAVEPRAAVLRPRFRRV